MSGYPSAANQRMSRISLHWRRLHSFHSVYLFWKIELHFFVGLGLIGWRTILYAFLHRLLLIRSCWLHKILTHNHRWRGNSRLILSILQLKWIIEGKTAHILLGMRKLIMGSDFCRSGVWDSLWKRWVSSSWIELSRN